MVSPRLVGRLGAPLRELPIPYIRDPLAFIGELVTLVSPPLTFVGGLVALVGPTLSLVQMVSPEP